MKAETTPKTPLFNLFSPEGKKKQVESDQITKVMISGEWIEIAPGSFHYYVTDTEKPVPYIQFDDRNGTRYECFPQSVGAYAYHRPNETPEAFT